MIHRPPSELADALRDRYVIERELGRGGMATVYLARDIRHDRAVALKVLHSELLSTLGAERFLREIHLTARLEHPHVVPVLDSGKAAGHLWYAMPCIEGESLRHRLEREGQLPLDHALHIAREIADALNYSHSHGIIHRDVKPENVLLSGIHARVCDFGIARALSVAGAETFTQAGMALGTPAYMSPEQASGEVVDGRSDIYSLGCVLYEMLAGQPPHTGPTAQAVLGKRLAGPVPSLRLVRGETPEAIDAALRKAMAKAPGDRFATPEEFSTALADVHTRVGPYASVLAARGPGWGRVLGVLAAALVGSTIVYLGTPKPRAREVDDRVVMVLPFRVAGADPSLSYLREGMLDLLAAKLTGDGGPRAVDPRTVLTAWRRAGGSATSDVAPESALAVAQGLGAGRVIQGSVVGTGSRLLFTAGILRARGKNPAPVSVEGPLDSLSGLVDRLTAAVLAGEAGETEKLADLATTSLPALRAYLEGRAAYRGNRFKEAISHFGRALDIDSSFALAALGLRSAAGWTVHGLSAMARGLALAWAARERLTPRDRLFLTAAAGPRYPARSPISEQLQAWERVTVAAPDQPEVHHELGDQLFHFGPLLAIGAAHERARAEFARALELDSTFSPSLSHLVDLAAHVHDTSALRSLGKMYISRSPPPDDLDYVRWRVATGLNDTTLTATLRDRFEGFSPLVLSSIYQTAQSDGIDLDNAERASALLLQKGTTRQDREDALKKARMLALNRGRPSIAERATSEYQGVETIPRRSLYWRVLDALYWDGDRVSARKAVTALADFADAPLARSAGEQASQVYVSCAVELWRLGLGETRTLAQAIPRLRTASVRGDTTLAAHTGSVCADLLDGLWAVKERRPDGLRKLALVDSILGTGPYMSRDFRLAAGLEVARMYEIQGDLARALRALRRRVYLYGDLEYLSTVLREEGRLSELAGDHPGAIGAYEHYLTLRSDPEPGLRQRTAAVRGELLKLLSEH